MVYRVKKSIAQYTLVDLLEILQYPSHPEYSAVQAELEKRSPSEQELMIARRGMVFRNKYRNKPLSFIDYLYCFLTPLIAPKNQFAQDKDVEQSYADQLTEYEIHNESRKASQLKKCRMITEITYGVISILIFIFLITMFLVSC